jgi:putative cell wall-binding protein
MSFLNPNTASPKAGGAFRTSAVVATIAASALVFGGALPAAAQSVSYFTIDGVIENNRSTPQPLAGIVVTAYPDEGHGTAVSSAEKTAVQRVVTDKDGEYQLRLRDDRAYDIHFTDPTGKYMALWNGAEAVRYGATNFIDNVETTVSYNPQNRGQARVSQAEATSVIIDLTLERTEVERLGGDNRYETAVAIAEAVVDAGVTPTYVYVATGADFPDALSAGAAAAYDGSVVVLVQKNSVPKVVRDFLADLGGVDIVIVGGTGVISEGVEETLDNLSSVDSVERVAGDDRYETSREILDFAWASAPSGMFVATGRNFPDALAASAAGAKLGGYPVLLVDGSRGSIDDDTLDVVDGFGGEIVIAGGTGAVSAGIARDLSTFSDGSVVRKGGADRYATALSINAYAFGSTLVGDSVEAPGFTANILIATGRTFPDALAGAALAGAASGALYLVSGDCLTASLAAEFSRIGVEKAWILGGEGAVGVGVESLRGC